MPTETTYTSARANFASLCNDVATTRDVVIVKRGGRMLIANLTISAERHGVQAVGAAVGLSAVELRGLLGAALIFATSSVGSLGEVVVRDTAAVNGTGGSALAMGKDLLDLGIYVSGFGFPVVPQGQARLRAQVSAAHTRADLDMAADAFVEVARRHGVLPA